MQTQKKNSLFSEPLKPTSLPVTVSSGHTPDPLSVPIGTLPPNVVEGSMDSFGVRVMVAFSTGRTTPDGWWLKSMRRMWYH
jgi:hypothetical protein